MTAHCGAGDGARTVLTGAPGRQTGRASVIINHIKSGQIQTGRRFATTGGLTSPENRMAVSGKSASTTKAGKLHCSGKQGKHVWTRCRFRPCLYRAMAKWLMFV